MEQGMRMRSKSIRRDIVHKKISTFLRKSCWYSPSKKHSRSRSFSTNKGGFHRFLPRRSKQKDLARRKLNKVEDILADIEHAQKPYVGWSKMAQLIISEREDIFKK